LLLRGEYLGWVAALVIVFFTSAVGFGEITLTGLVSLLFALNQGHSGGFAAGVLLGIVTAVLTAGLRSTTPYGLVFTTIGGFVTQWRLYGHHGFYSSAWLFEFGIATVVMWSTVLLMRVLPGHRGLKAKQHARQHNEV
jgi:hypothetical protein